MTDREVVAVQALADQAEAGLLSMIEKYLDRAQRLSETALPHDDTDRDLIRMAMCVALGKYHMNAHLRNNP